MSAQRVGRVYEVLRTGPDHLGRRGRRYGAATVLLILLLSKLARERSHVGWSLGVTKPSRPHVRAFRAATDAAVAARILGQYPRIRPRVLSLPNQPSCSSKLIIARTRPIGSGSQIAECMTMPAVICCVYLSSMGIGCTKPAILLQ